MYTHIIYIYIYMWWTADHPPEPGPRVSPLLMIADVVDVRQQHVLGLTHVLGEQKASLA